MAIDSSPFISGWNLSVPRVSDPRAEGANQIKAIKTAVHNCFPNIGGEVTADHVRMNQIFQAALPQVGMIMMFSGTEVPDGWAVCNGGVANNIVTPDLRGKFIMGATEEEKVGISGGKHLEAEIGKHLQITEHVLTVDQIPSHDHAAGDDKNPGYFWVTRATPNSRKITDYSGNNVDVHGITRVTKTGGGKGHAHKIENTLKPGSTTERQPYDKRPAYYTLAFIMYVGFSS